MQISAWLTGFYIVTYFEVEMLLNAIKVCLILYEHKNSVGIIFWTKFSHLLQLVLRMVKNR